MFATPIFADAFARAFAELPDAPLWQWADDHVWLEGNASAEPGPYRSAKTPWTRRLQELMQTPVMRVFDWSLGQWVSTPLKEISDMKSSQSGFTEGVLNAIRYAASFRPVNVIYTVDTRETARDISNRLLPSLEKLDGTDIFTGDDDDVGTFIMRLRGMDIWFQGSFSMGKFASKMAPLVISDESEEQGTDRTDTSTDTALKSRKKTADHGLYVALCKPKRKRGPIHRGFLRGNCEEYMVACPHCGYRQPLTFFRNEDQQDPIETPFSDEYLPTESTGELLLPIPLPQGQTRRLVTGRIVFDHCKDLLGQWDQLRILSETFYECGSCRTRIDESAKPQLLASARWVPTAHGTPGVVSQHINDLYSTDANSRWGQLVLDYLGKKREGRKELQGFFNHVLGLPWSDEVNKTAESDIKANIAGKTLYRLDAPGDNGQPQRKIFDRLEPAEQALSALAARGHTGQLIPSVCPPYRRGEVPIKGSTLLLGGDVGLNYAKWAVCALLPGGEDLAVIDWGTELDPAAVAELLLSQTWLCPENQKPYRIAWGFLDAKYRAIDVYTACLATQRRLMPCAGLGGTAARSVKVHGTTQIPGYPPGFLKLVFNDREAKDEYYLVRLKRKLRRVFFPLDVDTDPEFIAENCAEELIEDEHGRTIWNPHPGANHYGDSVKLAIVGARYATRRVAIPPL